MDPDDLSVSTCGAGVHSLAAADERLDLEKTFLKKMVVIYAHLRYIYWGPKLVCLSVFLYFLDSEDQNINSYRQSKDIFGREDILVGPHNVLIRYGFRLGKSKGLGNRLCL